MDETVNPVHVSKANITVMVLGGAILAILGVAGLITWTLRRHRYQLLGENEISEEANGARQPWHTHTGVA